MLQPKLGFCGSGIGWPAITASTAARRSAPVTAIPLSPFYESPPAGQRLARLCFAKNDATLDAALERLRLL